MIELHHIGIQAGKDYGDGSFIKTKKLWTTKKLTILK